jgi:hypothetical protein
MIDPPSQDDLEEELPAARASLTDVKNQRSKRARQPDVGRDDGAELRFIVDCGADNAGPIASVRVAVADLRANDKASRATGVVVRLG